MPVGSVPLSPLQVEEQLRRSFQAVPGRDRDLLVLRLDTGHTVVLQATISRPDDGMTVLASSRSGSNEAVDALRDRTGLTILTAT